MNVAEQALNIAQGRERDILTAEESDILIQHADIVAAPGQQGLSPNKEVTYR